MVNVLTEKDLKRAFNFLRRQKPPEYLWVDNIHFYKSELCKARFGANPTLKELKTAEKRENGYITQLRGIKLYLSRRIPSNSKQKG